MWIAQCRALAGRTVTQRVLHRHFKRSSSCCDVLTHDRNTAEKEQEAEARSNPAVTRVR